MPVKINQSKASAGRDIAARDINTINVVETPKSHIEKLLIRLQEEIENNAQVRDTIDELARYFEKRSHDGIDGLEAKIENSPITIDFDDAIEQKEMFAKLLRRYSMYHTAQQIFVHFLARVETEFKGVVHPQIPQKTTAEINSIILDRIAKPIVDECGGTVFVLNDNIVCGMVYWLAEQCFIRWHA